MAKKSPEELSRQPYQFSQLYYEKKSRIQESGYSDFIEFLNWVENINKGKKKEDGKRLIDNWFNKYSDGAIVGLFNMFVRFKNNRSQGYKYEDILNEAKYAFNTEIYGENIIRQLFGYYGNYLKYLKNKRVRAEAEEMEEIMEERVAEILKEEEETKKQGAENHYEGDDRDVVVDGEVVLNPKYENGYVDGEEENQPIIEENGQLKIPFDYKD